MKVKFKDQFYWVPQSGWMADGVPKFKLRYSVIRYDEFGDLMSGVVTCSETAEEILGIVQNLEGAGLYVYQDLWLDCQCQLHHRLIEG